MKTPNLKHVATTLIVVAAAAGLTILPRPLLATTNLCPWLAPDWSNGQSQCRNCRTGEVKTDNTPCDYWHATNFTKVFCDCKGPSYCQPTGEFVNVQIERRTGGKCTRGMCIGTTVTSVEITVKRLTVETPCE